MIISGIYQIQSKIKPERIYIGSSVGIKQRWNRHLSDFRNNKHWSKKFQNHYNKYGESDLQFSILLGCDKEDLIKIEQYFIDSYNPWFNNCKKAGSLLGAVSGMKGKKHSEASKKKMSESAIKRGYSIQAINKMKEHNTGKKLTEATKNKIRETLRGQRHTLERRLNSSRGHKGQIPNRKGVKLSQETINKMIETRRKNKLLKMEII